MGRKKKNTAGTTGGNLPTLRIGSRVRCTDDGVTGRIVWANAVSVKIQWDDGEQVTWKRDALATRPLEILDADRRRRPDHDARGHRRCRGKRRSQPKRSNPQSTAFEPTATTEQARPNRQITAATPSNPRLRRRSRRATADPTATETPTPTEPPATEPRWSPKRRWSRPLQHRR